MLAQPMETALRMEALAQPQSPTVVVAALTPIATVVATPITTVVATPITTVVEMSMTQPRTPPLWVATLQRRGQRLTQPPKKVLAQPRQATTVGCNIVRHVARSPHHHTLTLDLHLPIKVSGTELATHGCKLTPEPRN